MGTLADAFAKAAAAAKDDEITRTIVSFAAEGMWPFHTGTVTVWMDYNIDYMNHTLWVQIEEYPSAPFGHKIDDELMYRSYQPELYLIESIREPLIKHFRYRPALPVDDHIQLGED